MPRILAQHKLFSARQRKNKWTTLASSGSSTTSTASSSSYGSTISRGSNNDLLNAVVGKHYSGMVWYKKDNKGQDPPSSDVARYAEVTAPRQYRSFGDEGDDLDWGYFVDIPSPKEVRSSFERKHSIAVNDYRE